MSGQMKFWIAAAAGGACLLTLSFWWNAPSGDASDKAVTVLFDRHSGERFELAVEEIPAAHPMSGERTLYPALYCTTCNDWVPAPDAEVVQRRGTPVRCPEGHTTVRPSGPLPTEPLAKAES